MEYLLLNFSVAQGFHVDILNGEGYTVKERCLSSAQVLFHSAFPGSVMRDPQPKPSHLALPCILGPQKPLKDNKVIVFFLASNLNDMG